MSILFPIGGEPDAPASATFEGSGGFVASGRLKRRGSAASHGTGALDAYGSVSQRARATFAGLGTLIAGGQIVYHSTATLAGQGMLVAVGHVNAEGNALGSATLSGTGALIAQGRIYLGSGGGAHFEASGTLTAVASVSRAEAFGFTIFLDIVSEAIVFKRGTRYRARLTADGTEVPITAFALRAPRDVIGTSLSLSLTQPDPSLVSRTANLKFEIGVRQSGGASYVWVTVLDGGRLGGRSASIGMAQKRPTDTVQVSALDVLGDRWTLAPARPHTLYNPTMISAEEIGDAPGGLVKDDDDAPVASFKGFAGVDVLRTEGGAAVMPVRVAVDDLTLRRAVREAYVEGCGFADVVTNIPDYGIPRVDFTLEGGYHAGVTPLLALYEPIYHVSDDDTLWITDPDELSIDTAAVKQLPLSAVITVKNTLPVRQLVDALIVSYQEEGRDAEFVIGDRFENETAKSGSAETTTRRRIRQYGNPSQPGIIAREATIETTTTVRGEDGDIIHRETQSDTFDALNRKSGHTRTVESRVPDLDNDGELALLDVVEEKCSISYRAHPTRPRQWVQDLCVTEVRGLIHEDNDNPYRDAPFRLPMTDAHRNGFVDTSADQTSSFGPIKKTIESLCVRADGELDVGVIVIDEIAKTTERSSSTPRVGAVGGDARRNSVRRVLLMAEGVETVTRRVPEISGGDLPREVVLPLGHRKLRRMNNPPPAVVIGFPGLEFDIRRGSIVEPYNRAAADGAFIVAAWEMNGSALGTRDQYISMGLDCQAGGGSEE